ncbi:hypothetical protein A0H81_14541 [Grifola frondosa]|uniref:Uncharacterized protein n=1 Tax=Grifola frondosa TaxID=5627 RepID=A0A1C7LKZ1_GRIFR|nr:hypothetical protein A0H81_14541 [Grifola frondosa]
MHLYPAGRVMTFKFKIIHNITLITCSRLLAAQTTWPVASPPNLLRASYWIRPCALSFALHNHGRNPIQTPPPQRPTPLVLLPSVCVGVRLT